MVLVHSRRFQPWFSAMTCVAQVFVQRCRSVIVYPAVRPLGLTVGEQNGIIRVVQICEC